MERSIKNSKVLSRKKTSENENIITIGNIDYAILIAVILLVLIGIVMVFSSSYYSASKSENSDLFYYVRSQGFMAIIGFCAMIFMMNFNYRYLKKFIFPLYALSNILLVAVAIVGETTKGATRWIRLPLIGRFQPSEVAKIAVILLLALVISKNKDSIKKWPGFIFCSTLVVIPLILIAVGRNLSMVLLIGIIGFGIIFVASPHIWRFVLPALGAVGVLVMYLSVFSGGDFRGRRFLAWLDPFKYPLDEGYQTIQSLYAIASGGVFGLGLGQSRQKLGYIPESHNDIIFSVICEELGFIGAAIVLLLFGVIIWRGLRVALNATDLFGSLIATGIVIMIGSQAIINIAVVTNTIPNTGVTLPFISFGGTSLGVCMFAMGILLNISRYSKE